MRLSGLGVAGVLVSAMALTAQTTPATPANTFELQVNSRLIVEDVTVLDAKGNPVAGLPKTAFHITDDGAPQTLASFEAETGQAAAGSASPAAPSPIHSNAALYKNEGTLTVLLLDPTNIELVDQLRLRVQALRFIDTAPAGAVIGVFRANVQGVPVLLQEPTTDRALLRAAVNHAVPALVQNPSDRFSSAITELANISNLLRAVPGRKAVLWLSGEFPLYGARPVSSACSMGLKKDHCDPTADTQVEVTREAYRALEEARISVYPIDVRGVLMSSGASVYNPGVGQGVGGASSQPQQIAGQTGGTFSPESVPPAGGSQYSEMDRLADATGGKAFYSDNGIARVMDTALELASRGYTLSYYPTNAAADGAWHEVRLTVDGGYTVQYRRGYYAADSPPQRAAAARELRAADAKTGDTAAGTAPPAAPDAGEPQPLIFSARAMSVQKQGRSRVITMRYIIPAAELRFADDAGSSQAKVRLAAIAYDAAGDLLADAMEVVNTRYTASQMQLADRIGTPADQTITIKGSAQFLLLSVEDLATKRVGTLSIPVAQLDDHLKGK